MTLCVNIPADMRVALHAAGGRPLRRLQRLALPLRDRSAHRRLHDQLRPRRAGNGAPRRKTPSRRRTCQSLCGGVRRTSVANPPLCIGAGNHHGNLTAERIDSSAAIALNVSLRNEMGGVGVDECLCGSRARVARGVVCCRPDGCLPVRGRRDGLPAHGDRRPHLPADRPLRILQGQSRRMQRSACATAGRNA